MANTLFSHYHARDYNFNPTDVVYAADTTQHYAMKKDLPRPQQGKLSKLELLQEDYRSRLLHEKEQKLNALFEQKVRANLLPKKGSVREFFLNRRILATSTKSGQNAVTLPPMQLNSRHESVQPDKKRFVDEMQSDIGEVGKRKVQTRRQPRLKQSGETLVPGGSSRKLVELREARQKYQQLQKQESDPSRSSKLQSREKGSSSTFASFKDRRLVSRTDQKDGVTTYPKRTSQSKDVYKRAMKLGHGDEINETNSARSHANESSCSKDELSKNLAKIKELGRRKTEEFLHRSMTNNLALDDRFHDSKSCQPSPRKNSLKLEEMHRMEMELRETISRERKKLLVLQQRRREVLGETTRENDDENKNELKTSKTKQSNCRDSNNELDNNSERTASHEWPRQRLQTRSTKQVARQSTEMKFEKLNSNADAAMDLMTCSNCGRCFVKERISKHENACKKASARKKKPFDARKKRAQGTEMEKYFIAEVVRNDKPAREASI